MQGDSNVDLNTEGTGRSSVLSDNAKAEPNAATDLANASESNSGSITGGASTRLLSVVRTQITKTFEGEEASDISVSTQAAFENAASASSKWATSQEGTNASS